MQLNTYDFFRSMMSWDHRWHRIVVKGVGESDQLERNIWWQLMRHCQSSYQKVNILDQSHPDSEIFTPFRESLH